MISFKKITILLFWAILIFAFTQKQASADTTGSNLPSITVINLIRGQGLGHEKDNLFLSLKDQWKVTKDNHVNATWLFQYSALEDTNLINFAKTEMKNQEFGLMFEIDKNFANKSNVSYRGQGPWYFSDGLLLVSYDLAERKKLIDAAFSKFYKTFGFYPKTVGAWYIGADSLSYMQQKYHIVAALKAADQFNLDMYTIWGAPWSIPYLSSTNNQSVPADSYLDSSKVVNIQWAARDPNRGYQDQLFSVQDFTARIYEDSYIDYLSNIFLKNKYDNLVFGLENGGDLKVFEKYYKTMIQKAKALEKSGKVKLSLAKDFATQFLFQEKPLSGTHYFLAKDYKTDDQSFWYISSKYRIYIQKTNDKIFIADIRNYSSKINEDYLLLNNSQALLRASAPFILDSIVFPRSKKMILQSNEPMYLEKKSNGILLKAGDRLIGVFNQEKFKLNENGKENLFDFSKKGVQINIFIILFMIFTIYSVLCKLIFKKNASLLILFIPLFLAYPFLSSGLLTNLNYVFDRKELFLFNFFASPFIFSNLKLIFIFQILPFIFLLIFNFLHLWKSANNALKIVYFSVLTVTALIYVHLPYFPLDGYTFKIIAVITTFLILFMLIIFAFLLKLTKSKKIVFALIFVTFVFIGFSGIIVMFSRTKTVLTSFEAQALEVIKKEHKDVIYVSQIDYNIKPIYKATKPFLYENINLAEKLTATHWVKVLRPEDNVLKISNYKNKLILIPRYLGSDLSEYEENKLNLKKTFDNYQIAIFEEK